MLGAFQKAGINEFKISIKFCVFLIPMLIFFKKKFFLGHNCTFCNLKMQMRKKLYIFKHFAKRKKVFFSKYLSFSVWFPLSLKHWSPLPLHLLTVVARLRTVVTIRKVTSLLERKKTTGASPCPYGGFLLLCRVYYYP